MARIIFHIDMNCYFVSCEIANHPEFNDKPIAVAPQGSSRKSIILTASYEARKYGVHSAMRVSDALVLCPDLVLLDSHMELYAEYSRKFFDYFLSITPLVEPASIDEAYLDVTDVCPPDKIINLANDIQQHLLNNLGLPCSIGIAPNKFLAKMGSDLKKPLGITIMRKREIKEVLWPLPVEDMPGVGKKTLENLRFLKIKTIGDLANYPNNQIFEDIFGSVTAKYLKRSAFGEGETEVDINRFTDFSSISNSQTFEQDLFDLVLIYQNLKILVNTVANRLEKHEYKAKTFSIKIRYNDFRTITRARTVETGINDAKEIFQIIKDLFDDYYDSRLSVRLLGVAASKLTESKVSYKQLTIFDDLDKEEKDNRVQNILKEINQNLGENTIFVGIGHKNKDKYNKDYLEDLKEIRKK